MPGRPTCAPTISAMALNGAYRTIPTVVSSSAKPRRAASAASAAIWTGWSFTLVTCAWLAGDFRARILVTAIIISRTVILLTTSVILAGVIAVVRETTSHRGTLMSHSFLASSRESILQTASAFSSLMP